MNTDLQIITASQNPDLVGRATSHIDENWPEFMLHDPVAGNFTRCYRDLPQYQFILYDKTAGQAAAIGNSIPLSWDGKSQDLPEEGWDWAMTQGINDLTNGTKTNTLSALQVVVFNNYRGQGISTLAVDYMRKIARDQGFNRLIAPVRPSQSEVLDKMTFEEYVNLKNKKGLPADPWLRVHCRLGGEIIKICHNSMKINGTVAQWEEWVKRDFPESGNYKIQHALNEIYIDLEKDRGTYIEPNVWVVHSL